MKVKNQNIMVLDIYKSNYKKIKVKCKNCLNEWNVKPNNLLNGTNCLFCAQSKGEKEIAMFLTKNSISFEKEKKFPDLLSENGINLRFDFCVYLNNKMILIEFDGKHHFKEITYFGKDKLSTIKKRDKIKNQYVLKNRIPLIRISYTEFKNINKILKEKLEIAT